MNNNQAYIKKLVEDIHSVVVATIDENGRPSTRVIDMMLYDEKGVYFLTAQTKPFFRDLMDQKYISLSCVQNKCGITLKGHVRNIGKEKLNEIFEKNPYMYDLYPNNRDVLDVFQIYDAQGSYFDISDPKNVQTGEITIGR